MCDSKPSFLPGFRQLYSMAPPSPYPYWLREATKKLYDSFFGSWHGSPSTDVAIVAALFGNEDDKYDKRYWYPDSDDKFGVCLRLKAGKSPAEAISAILENLILWRIDCDHTVQISNLYAMSKVLGATKFDQARRPGDEVAGARIERDEDRGALRSR